MPNQIISYYQDKLRRLIVITTILNFLVVSVQASPSQNDRTSSLKQKISAEVIDHAMACSKLGAPMAMFGAVPGAGFGFMVSFPAACASALMMPAVSLTTGNILMMPISTVVAPMAISSFGTLAGAQLGMLISGTTGYLGGCALGGLFGAVKFCLTNTGDIITSLNHKIWQHSEDPIESQKAVCQKIKLMLENQQIKTNWSKNGTCYICFDTIKKEEHSDYIFKLCQCQEKSLCRECWDHYLASNSGGYDYPLLCPGNCQQQVLVDDLRALGISSRDINSIDHHYVKKLACLNPQFKFCPTEACMNGAMVSNVEKNWNCQECEFLGCIFCGDKNVAEDHSCNPGKSSLEKLLAKGRCARSHEDPAKGAFRPCYYCGKVIERIDGCNRVHCKYCDNYFDWNFGIEGADGDFSNSEMRYSPLVPAHF